MGLPRPGERVFLACNFSGWVVRSSCKDATLMPGSFFRAAVLSLANDVGFA